MARHFHKIRKYLEHNRFIVTIAGAILISVLLAGISVAIYVRDGSILLDLSRPSYAPVREKIKKDNGTPAFDANGKIDAAVLEDFYTQISQQKSEINKLGTFDAHALSDKVLQLSP